MPDNERNSNDDKNRRDDRSGRPRRSGGSDRSSRPQQGGPRRNEGERRPARDGQPQRDGRPARDGRAPYSSSAGDRNSRPPFNAGSRDSRPPRADGDRRPYGNRDDRGGERKPYGNRDSRPSRADGDRKPYGNRDDRGGDRKPYGNRDDRGGRPAPRYGSSGGDSRGGFERRGNDRFGGERRSRPPQDTDRRAEKSRDPEIPEEITARDLHPSARNELKTLSKENAESVARHLAMVAKLIDEDPKAAHEHALAASRRAGRVAVVRETVALTAYAIEDYALALRELRTYRRISGRDDQIALIVDSERGVGRPERAIEEGRAVDRSTLEVASRVELAMAMSGARLDLGETERALLELDIPELDPDRAFDWSPALFQARATVLEELGRTDEAAEWHHRALVAANALDEAAGGTDEEIIVVEEFLEVEDLDERAAAEDADAPDAQPSDEQQDADDAVDAADASESDEKED